MDKKNKPTNAYGEHSDSDNSSDEDVQELQTHEELAKLRQNKTMKTSVSAEVYGAFNKQQAFKPREIQKNQDQQNRIKAKLEQAFMFSALDDKDKQIVILAMEEKTFKAGETVIKQGDDGDVLYLIDQGQLDCYKLFKGSSEPKHLKVYQPGESFGELALLYNAPRAATIISKTDSVLFALDRECFNHIVKDAASKKRQAYEALLSKIDILGEMDAYERLQIADALKSVKFKKDEVIIKEGDQGDTFYFLEQGQAVAQKGGNTVMEYKQGDYFGELALLKDQPRAATVIATTEVTLATMDRASFKRLLGPVEDLMRRNASKYSQHLN